jgi:hypothetical protein
LKGLGSSWTWKQTILANGVESPGCTATSPVGPPSAASGAGLALGSVVTLLVSEVLAGPGGGS